MGYDVSKQAAKRASDRTVKILTLKRAKRNLIERRNALTSDPKNRLNDHGFVGKFPFTQDTCRELVGIWIEVAAIDSHLLRIGCSDIYVNA